MTTPKNEPVCADCGVWYFNEGLVRRGKVWKCEDCLAKEVKPSMNEKKCTCGDTETQHYENTDKCVVCGCKEFEERYEMPQFEGTYEALDKITINPPSH